MSRWNSLSNVWSTTWDTLRELDVNAIREESERPFSLACFGQPGMHNKLADLLYADTTPHPGPPAGASPTTGATDPLVRYYLPLRVSDAEIQRADMLILLLDGRRPLTKEAAHAIEQLLSNPLPFLITVFYRDSLPEPATNDISVPMVGNRFVAIRDPDAPEAAETLGLALVSSLPTELHLTAARRLPGLRFAVAGELIAGTAFTNSTYALLSGISEQFPVLNMTVAAADMLILTKNQILMLYKIGLVHGAPAHFQGILREVLLVLTMAYLWRQVARSLVTMMPIFDVLPKIAVSYIGTYVVGTIARRWFEHGDVVSAEQIRRLAADALQKWHHLRDASTVSDHTQHKPAQNPPTRRSLERPR